LDNIIKKIKTGFLNSALIKKLNEKLKEIGSRLNLEKFPKNFVSDINHKRNNQLLQMTLKEIFEKKELYKENELSINVFLRYIHLINYLIYFFNF
jgi:hypothetical protein